MLQKIRKIRYKTNMKQYQIILHTDGNKYTNKEVVNKFRRKRQAQKRPHV